MIKVNNGTVQLSGEITEVLAETTVMVTALKKSLTENGHSEKTASLIIEGIVDIGINGIGDMPKERHEERVKKAEKDAKMEAKDLAKELARILS